MYRSISSIQEETPLENTILLDNEVDIDETGILNLSTCVLMHLIHTGQYNYATLAMITFDSENIWLLEPKQDVCLLISSLIRGGCWWTKAGFQNQNTRLSKPGYWKDLQLDW